MPGPADSTLGALTQSHSQEYVPHVCDLADIPVADVGIEGGGTPKHVGHDSDLAVGHRVMSMSFSVKKLLLPFLNAMYSADFLGNPLFIQQCFYAWHLRLAPKGLPQKRHHGPFRLCFGISTCGDESDQS